MLDALGGGKGSSWHETQEDGVWDKVASHTSSTLQQAR